LSQENQRRKFYTRMRESQAKSRKKAKKVFRKLLKKVLDSADIYTIIGAERKNNARRKKKTATQRKQSKARMVRFASVTAVCKKIWILERKCNYEKANKRDSDRIGHLDRRGVLDLCNGDLSRVAACKQRHLEKRKAVPPRKGRNS